MRIIVRTVPHKCQRYPTLGDWQFESASGDQFLIITVSKLGDWRAEMALALHEQVEALLCLQAGITQDAVDAFDLKFLAEQRAGLIPPGKEPGDSLMAPYHRQHLEATAAERRLIEHLGMSWVDYETLLASVEEAEAWHLHQNELPRAPTDSPMSATSDHPMPERHPAKGFLHMPGEGGAR